MSLYFNSILSDLKHSFSNFQITKFSNYYFNGSNPMYFLVGLWILTLSCNISPMKTITVGNIVPDFTLEDQNGNIFTLNSVLGKKNLVIFFYPKDDSPGCTKEACYFRDQFEVFRQTDAVIIGISGQSVKSHKQFADKYHLSYTLLSDRGNKLRKQFGVPTNFLGMLPGRVTYVIDKSGKVVFIFDSQMQIHKHVDEALAILKKL